MRAPAPRPHPSESTDLLLGAMAVSAVLVVVLWAAGAASAWVSGHRFPRGDLLAGVAAFAHGGDPSRAWHAPVGPACPLLGHHLRRPCADHHRRDDGVASLVRRAHEGEGGSDGDRRPGQPAPGEGRGWGGELSSLGQARCDRRWIVRFPLMWGTAWARRVGSSVGPRWKTRWSSSDHPEAARATTS